MQKYISGIKHLVSIKDLSHFYKKRHYLWEQRTATENEKFKTGTCDGITAAANLKAGQWSIARKINNTTSLHLNCQSICWILVHHSHMKLFLSTAMQCTCYTCTVHFHASYMKVKAGAPPSFIPVILTVTSTPVGFGARSVPKVSKDMGWCCWWEAQLPGS